MKRTGLKYRLISIISTIRLQYDRLRPLLPEFSALASLACILVTLLLIVFTKMELRRLGYAVWRLKGQERLELQEVSLIQAKVAQLTRPERLRKIAGQQKGLKYPDVHQIIYINEEE